MMSGARKLLSFEQKRYLLHVYLTQGYTAAKPIAIKYGIKPRSMSEIARKAGHRGKQGREPGVWNMKPTPIHIVVARLRRIPLHHQISHLRALVALEKPFSVRRNELESLLTGKLTKQLRKEISA